MTRGKTAVFGAETASTNQTPNYLSRRLVAPEPCAKAEAGAKADELSTLNKRRLTLALNLLVHDLDLLVEHLAGEPIDRHACHAEALAKAGCTQ